MSTVVVIVALVTCLVICILIMLFPPIESATQRAGGIVRTASRECTKTFEFCLFGIGMVNHDGGVDLRFYVDGIGVTPNTLGSELFFSFQSLRIEQDQRRGDACKLKIVAKLNGKEVFFPPHIRPTVIEYLREHGV
jgi:hypothetical protein